MTRTWFKNTNCMTMTIEKYVSISDHKVVNRVEFTDPDVVQDFMKRIQSIPPAGNMMKSFSEEAEHIQLFFNCDQYEKQTINIFGRRVQTPSTGYNSTRGEVELSLYQDIDNLLFPDLDKKILKVFGVELDFKKFKVVYKGKPQQRRSPDQPEGGATQSDHFQIIDSKGKKEMLTISSGQLPPQPQVFEVDKVKFTLDIFETAQKDRLFPKYFQIRK